MIGAVVLAGGASRRMGQDKALLELGGRLAIERVVAACVDGGVEQVVVVRNGADAELPTEALRGAVVARAGERGEMLDSLRLGMQQLPAAVAATLVFPVDYSLVTSDVVRALLDAAKRDSRPILLPLWEERPGHPVVLDAALFAEVMQPATTSLREIIGRDPARVGVVPVDSPWVRRDLDTPTDLAAARSWLAAH